MKNSFFGVMLFALLQVGGCCGVYDSLMAASFRSPDPEVQAVLTPQNIVPQNVVPGGQGITYRNPHVMNFQVTDSDSTDSNFLVRLIVGKGILNATALGGASLTGNGSSVLEIVGTIGAVNQTLWGADEGSLGQGIVYTYTGADLAPNEGTQDTLTMLSYDNVRFLTGTDSDNVPLFINNPFVEPAPSVPSGAVCGVPELDLSPQTANFTVGDGATYDIVFSDAFAVAPLQFSITGGTLPADVSFASDGTVTNASIIEGTTVVTVRVRDANGCVGTADLTINIQP